MIFGGRRCYYFCFARKKGKITGIGRKVAVPAAPTRVGRCEGRAFCERNTMRKLNSTFIGLISVLALFGGLSTQTTGAAEPLARITVDAGEHTRIDTPVSVSLEGVALGPGEGAFMLVEKAAGETATYPAQLEAGSPAKLWFILGGETKPGTKRTYELTEAPKSRLGLPVEGRTPGARPPAARVSVRQTQDYCDILYGDTKVLRYNNAVVPPPAGQSELYKRSGFIHPLWSPAGSVLTNIHAPDHIHHLGIWMPWTHTEFEGKSVDFWNLKEGQGTVRFVKYLATTDGPVFGGFQVEQEHVALKTAEGEKVVLKEVWDVRVYNVGGPGKGYWLWDFKSTQRCVADSPLRQIEYRYGGFGFRGAAEWDEQTAEYLTSEGKTRKDGHATRARWCDTSGKIKEWEGVTFYSHPENFRHPEPMRIWPEGQVFFNWAPSQAGDWEMKPGEDHVFRYRLYVHEGKVNVADAERIWADYAEPPKVTIEAAARLKSRLGLPAKDAIVLFDGKPATAGSHWTTGGDKEIGWKIADGEMTIVPGSGSIMTKQNFTDFKMHVEFKTPQLPPEVKGQGRGNSGVYIQRRYEVQILDSYGLEPKNNECASIYTFKAPDKNVCKKPGEWQSYDITFRAARYEGQKKVKNARISLVHNGVLVHDDVEVPNKTGAGQPEGPEPGPILLQEHGNVVSFRNITIVPLQE